jgi:hypothetical protein
MKELKILWIEDEHEDMRLFKSEAASEGIYFDVFASAEEGLDALEASLDTYDGVLLDAEFLMGKGQTKGTANVAALSKVWSRLDELRSRKAFTPFILTGKKHLEGNDVFKATYGTFYRKWKDQERKQLLQAIRHAAETLADTQIRHRYHRIFGICTERYIGDAAADHLLTILRNVNGVDSELKDDLYFNHLRKCLEWLFRAAQRQGLLHEKCIDARGGVNLRCSSLFMAGEKVNVLGVKCSKAHFPPLIAYHVGHILDVTNAYSHTESWEQQHARIQLDEYRATVRSPYLLFGLTFMLLDVLLWFKHYADAHPNVADNRSLWQDLEQSEGPSDEQMGIVINKNPQGFAFFKPDSGADNAFIRARIVSEHDLQNAVRVAVRTKLEDKGSAVTSLRVLTSIQ